MGSPFPLSKFGDSSYESNLASESSCSHLKKKKKKSKAQVKRSNLFVLFHRVSKYEVEDFVNFDYKLRH